MPQLPPLCWAEAAKSWHQGLLHSTAASHMLRPLWWARDLQLRRLLAGKKSHHDSSLQVVSASSDATVRVWDAKSCDCLVTFRPPQSSAGAEASISSVHFNPQNLEQLVVCPRASTIYVMTMQVILR